MAHKEQKKIILKTYELWYKNYSVFEEGEFTGVVEILGTGFFKFKEGKLHCEDGPAIKKIHPNRITKEWWLDGYLFFSSSMKGYQHILNFKNRVVLDKFKHPKYPLVQVFQVLNKERIEKQCIIPGMESYIIE